MTARVKKIHQVSKTNSSHGNWAVWVTIENTVGGHTYTMEQPIFFWTKAETMAIEIGNEIEL